MNLQKVISFVDLLVSNEFKFDLSELEDFDQDELKDIISILATRVQNREYELKVMVKELEERVSERTRELKDKNLLLDLKNALLEKKNQALEQLAISDQLTGLFNRRYFDEKLNEYSNLMMRIEQPLSCLMADIDHFKNLNDTYGHQAGDQVLAAIARILRDSSRKTDICARYGGEEFIMLLPNTTSENAFLHAEEIRLKIQDSSIRFDSKSLRVTLSIGVGVGEKESDLFEALVKTADRALYRAKESGRNRVVS